MAKSNIPLSLIFAFGLGALEYVFTSGMGVVGFTVGLYGWHAIQLCISFFNAVTSDDPTDVLNLLSDDDPALPLTAFALSFVTAYWAFTANLIPFLPSPRSEWSLLTYGIALAIFFTWFIVCSGVFVFGVMSLGEGCRWLLGRENVDW